MARSGYKDEVGEGLLVPVLVVRAPVQQQANQFLHQGYTFYFP